jgi:hypothetical protein
MKVWYPHESGATIGRRGPEGGRVVQDLQLGDPNDPEDADARLTLESDGEGHARTIANLYGGWLYLVIEQDAMQTLQPELERLAALIPWEGERDVETRVRALMQEIEALENRFLG